MFVRGRTSGFLGGAGGGASVELTSDGGGLSGPGGACAFPSHAQTRHAPLTATTLPNRLIFVTFLRLEVPDYLLTASLATGQKFPHLPSEHTVGILPSSIWLLGHTHDSCPPILFLESSDSTSTARDSSQSFKSFARSSSPSAPNSRNFFARSQ